MTSSKRKEHENVEHTTEAKQGEETHGAATAEKDVEALQRELEEEKAKAAEYLQHWQRSQADFINYKRRVEQEKSEQAKYAKASLVLKILPVLDDFDRALANLPREVQRMTWVEGIALIDRKLRFILEQEGVTPIEALGKDFDPMMHEAVLFDEGADPQHGKVVAELQKGYKLYDKVIRPTLVKVGQLPPEATANQEQDESSHTTSQQDR